MSKTIEIITIATGSYIQFIPFFLKNMPSFFNDCEKHIIIYTDADLSKDEGLKTFLENEANKDLYTIELKKIYQLLYATLLLNKPVFIKEAINESYDYTFYFDIDTLFKNDVDDTVYDTIRKKMDEGYMILTKHPIYAMEEDEYFNGAPKANAGNFLWNLEAPVGKKCHIDNFDSENYCIASFYGGKTEIMKKFVQRLIDMENGDLQRKEDYFVPRFIDENYLNKIVNEYQNGDLSILLDIGSYNELYGLKNKKIKSIFMYQKNFPIVKKERL